MSTYARNLEESINLIGHPYAPIGMGEHVRCTYRALRSVAVHPCLTDIYKLIPPDKDDLLEFGGVCRNQPADINIFHINGNEVEQCMAHLRIQDSWSGYNIIYPAWELAQYPDEWAVLLDWFDEIWAPSEFIRSAIEAACEKPVIHMPLACEVVLTTYNSRRYFGIPDTDYTFLFFFDVRSFVTRKNPFAVIESFRRMLRSRPFAKTSLILKVNGAEMAPEVMIQIQSALEGIEDSVFIFDRLMTDNEAKNLVRCCDCFVSLHRSEGFGRGLSEAMALGKPVIATGYSGNMDFMNESVSFPVSYDLIPVLDGEYPFWQNQVWADPDVTQASYKMIQLVDAPEFGRIIGSDARLHMQEKFSYSVIGMNYRRRLEEIFGYKT
jgi:glycosyltransferase involved in cell wall biosynthesis